MDLLARGSRHLYQRMHDTSASEVLYKRPGVGQFSVRATFGNRSEQAVDADGVELWIKKPDFIIRKDRLVLNYKKISPLIGDEVEWTDENGDKHTCEVVSRGDGEPPARNSDRFGHSWRIHTSRIKVQTVG